MLKKIFFGFSSLFFAAVAFGAPNPAEPARAVTTVEVQKGEKWWGLTYDEFAQEGLPQAQPFSAPFDITEKNKDFIATPVLVSNAGRYVFAPDMRGVKFDGQRFAIITTSGNVQVEKAGKTLREAHLVCALKNFTPGTATPDADLFVLPLYRTLGELGFAQGESEIVEYAQKLISEGFPPGILVICDGWQNINGPYEFDKALYPDPKGLVDRLHAIGFKVMLTVSPYVPAWGKVYGDARKKEQLLQTTRDMLSSYWPPVTEKGVLDMADPEQFQRIRSGLEDIKNEIGFDGYFFDCGDAPLASEEFRRNMMSLGKDIGMAIYRRGESVTYAPYAESVTTFWAPEDFFKGMVGKALAGGMIGHPYLLFDSHVPAMMDDEAKMAGYLLLQSVMPVVNVAFAPWRITDPGLYGNVKEALNFRASLGEYMRQAAAETARMGTPLVRHMEYQFPKQGFADCGDQFMLGSKYLIAPCIDGTDKRLVRLPKGNWIDSKGAKVKGPVVKEIDCAEGLMWYELAK